MKAYKGFTKDLKCRDFQFKEGKEYVHEGEVKCCGSGFHACEYPLDCFRYYNPAESVYHEVELAGTIDKQDFDGDTKVSAQKIKVGARLSIAGIVKAAVDFVFVRAKPVKGDNAKKDKSAVCSTGDMSANSATGNWSANSATGNMSANSATGDMSANSATGNMSANSATGNRSANSATGNWSANSATGNYSANSATGNYSANSATGDYSANSATGNYSANSATGYGSANSATGYGSANLSTGVNCINNGAGEANISIGWGRDNKCKGSIGSYLVLSEWGEWDGKKYPLIGAKMVVVDGKKIKADVYYALKNV